SLPARREAALWGAPADQLDSAREGWPSRHAARHREPAAVLLQLVLHLPHADAEDLGGAHGRAADVVERAQDGVALDLEEGRARDEPARAAAVGAGAAEPRREV